MTIVSMTEAAAAAIAALSISCGGSGSGRGADGGVAIANHRVTGRYSSAS